MEINSIIGGKIFPGTNKQEYSKYFLNKSDTVYINLLESEENILKNISDFPRNNFEEILTNLIKLIEKNYNSYSKLLAIDCSIPLFRSKSKMKNVLVFLKKCLKRYNSEKLKLNKQSITLLKKGVVLISLSGPDPLEGFINCFIPALYMGNKIYVKPSKNSSYLIYKILKDYISSFKDSNFINLLIVDRNVVKKLILNKAFNYVYWTGSYNSAKEIYSLCAQSFTEFYFEGSGADSLYISEDFNNWNLLNKTILNTLTNLNGKNCNKIQTIFIQEKAYSNICSRLKKIISKISFATNLESLGNGLIGPMNNVQEVERLSSIVSQITFSDKYKALENKDLFYSPEILIQEDSQAYFGEEINGPIIVVRRIKSLEECINFQNKNNHCLGFTIFINKPYKKENKDIISRLYASRLNINKDPLGVSLFDPWGGIKRSGFGGAKSWLEKFSNRLYTNGN